MAEHDSNMHSIFENAMNFNLVFNISTATPILKSLHDFQMVIFT